MAHILTIKSSGTRPRPDIGPFHWDERRGCFAWRGRVLRTAEELAEAVNAVAPWLRMPSNSHIEISVIAVAEAPAPPGAGLKRLAALK